MEKFERDFMGNMVRKGNNLMVGTYNSRLGDDSLDALLYTINRKDNNFDYVVAPRNKILDLRAEMNPEEYPKWSLECLDPYLINKEDLEKVWKGKEGNKMSDTNKILYIYEDVEAKRIREHYANKIEKIEKESQEAKVSKKVREYATKELKKVFPDYDESDLTIVSVTYRFSEETKKIIAELEKEKRKDLEKLDERLKEIKALLDMTETFEQKMQILFAYDVVDEKGVIKK